MPLSARFQHVSPATVRFWAMVDSGVLALALPWTATLFLGALYWFNGLLGHEDQAPVFGTLQMFFVNLSGVMVGVWVAARLLNPVGMMALVDGIGRLLVALLLVGYILGAGAPPILWFFVFTEVLGAIPQLRACLRRP